MAGRSSTLQAREPGTSVAVYRRVIEASLERIWENVLDWEHLPWLHAQTFRHVRLLDAGDAGWRAEVALCESLGGAESEVEVTLERPQLYYTTRTVAGAGKGTVIVTRLEPVAQRRTRIEVEFFVPGIAEDQTEAVGSLYRQTYARLWDEDEQMMLERQRVLDARAGNVVQARDWQRAPVPLGDANSLRRRLPLFVEVAGRTYRLERVGEDIIVFDTVCPHRGGPLRSCPIDEGGAVTCPWHGYRFDVRTGRSTDGRKLRLSPGPSVEIDKRTGEAMLVWRRRRVARV